MTLASRKRQHDVRMQRNERDRRRSMAWRVACGKLAFLSKKGAKRYCKHHWPGNAAVRVYRCPTCGGWHTTSDPTAQRRETA